MDTIEKTHQGVIDADTPEVKPKHPGGRKPKGYYERGIQDILNGSAPSAARLLDDHLNQRRGHKTIKDTVLKACFYVIDHAIGKARQKVEHTVGVLTYKALLDSAESLEKTRPTLLIDTEKISKN